MSNIINPLGRLHLNDDGKRDWYEESVRYLQLNFPDWRYLERTVMIPPAFPVSLEEASQGDITEKRVYDLLQEFGTAYQQPMFVVHSHQFADLIEEKKKGFPGKVKKWNKGEHDFVIIHREYGFVFLQVKSSTCEDGQAFKKAKWQIQKDIESIKAFLDECFAVQLPSVARVLYNYPGFVVMPNCQPTRVPIDPSGVFMNDCKDKESFKKWWDDKVVTDNKRVMNKDLYAALVVRFVALRCSSPSTSSQIDETHKQIVYFHTPEQLNCMLTAGAEQWWAGPAGSGKTVLLKTKVKELAREILNKKVSERILVVCFNKPLSVHLSKNLEEWWRANCPRSQPLHSTVHVRTYDSFIKLVITEILQLKDGSELYLEQKPDFDRRRHDVETHFETNDVLFPSRKYQHIFVDEAQDFHGTRWLNVLRKFHDQDAANRQDNTSSTTNNDITNTRYFWVFFDSNQYVQLRQNESIFWLSNPNVFRLTKVLRNTENIYLLAKTYYSEDRERIALGHGEVGMNVVYDDRLASDRSNGVHILTQHVQELIKKKVLMRDIAILTKIMKDASLQNLPIPYCNAEKTDGGNGSIIVDSIRRFKGLESKIVILYDPPYKLDENIVETSALLYTAISRCFCYLLIVSTVEGCKIMKERVDVIKYQGKEENDGGSRSKDWD